MSRIKTKIEFEFMMEALREKFSTMMDNLDDYEEDDEDDELPANFVLTQMQVNAMKKAGILDDIDDQFDKEYEKRKDAFVKKTPVRRGRPPAKKTSKK